MTNREVIQLVLTQIQPKLSKGIESTSLDQRYVYDKLLSNRSRLIVQEHSKNKNISYNCYQTLSEIEMIETTNYNSSCLPNVGFKVMKSVNKLPKIIQLRDKPLISQVSTLENSILFSYTNQKEIKYKKGARFTAEKPDYYLDEYLYLVSKTGPKVVKMIAVFERPTEAELFFNMCDTVESCYKPLDLDFLLDERLIQTAVQMTIQDLLSIKNNEEKD